MVVGCLQPIRLAFGLMAGLVSFDRNSVGLVSCFCDCVVQARSHGATGGRTRPRSAAGPVPIPGAPKYERERERERSLVEEGLA